MRKNIIVISLIFNLLGFGIYNSFAVTYTWNGASANWNTAANWVPFGIPGAGDNVFFTGLSIIDPQIPAGGVSVTDFSVSTGGLLGGGFDCNNDTLKITGDAQFNTGTYFNGSILCSGNSATLNNVTLNTNTVIMCSSIITNNSIFNGKTCMTKTGNSNDYSDGGNQFNDSTCISMSGTGTLRFSDNSGDSYNDYSEFHWTSGNFEPCYSRTNTFSGDVWFDASVNMNFASNISLIGNNQTIRITGVDSAVIDTLDLSSATGTVTLDGNIVLPNSSSILQLGGTNLDLNGHELRIRTDNNNSISRTTGYIISESTDNSSKISWDIGNSASLFTFPLGNSNGTYIPFQIQVTSGDIGTMSVATYGTGNDNLPLPISPEPVSQVNGYTSSSYDNSAFTIDRFWQIDKTGSGTSTITFTYDELELGGGNTITETSLFAQRWNSSLQDWEDGVGTVNAASNTVTATGVSNFSPWTLTDNGSALPVEWMSFSTSLTQSNNVHLSWATITESNNSHFTIEKLIIDNQILVIDFVDGAQNSNSVQNYSYTDKSTTEGLSYYRIKQTDFEGNSTFTDWKSINIKSSNNALVYLLHDQLIIKTPKVIGGNVIVYSLDGQIVGSGELSINNTSNLPVSVNSTGVLIYSIHYENGEIQTGKVLKN